MAKKNIRSSYKYYKNLAEKPVDRASYAELNNLYNKFLVAKVLQGNVVTLPSNLGTLQVMGFKTEIRFNEEGKPIGLAPDFAATKKLWESNPEAKAKKTLMYHLNTHTEGFRYRWHWKKSGSKTKNKMLYSLKMTRENKRTLSKMIKDGVQYKTK